MKISSLEGKLLQTLKMESMRPTGFKTLCFLYNAMFFFEYIDVKIDVKVC